MKFQNPSLIFLNGRTHARTDTCTDGLAKPVCFHFFKVGGIIIAYDVTHNTGVTLRCASKRRV